MFAELTMQIYKDFFKSPNFNGNITYSIGKVIIDDHKYNELLKIRGLSAEDIEKIKYFPKYRVND